MMLMTMNQNSKEIMCTNKMLKTCVYNNLIRTILHYQFNIEFNTPPHISSQFIYGVWTIKSLIKILSKFRLPLGLISNNKIHITLTSAKNLIFFIPEKFTEKLKILETTMQPLQSTHIKQSYTFLFQLDLQVYILIRSKHLNNSPTVFILYAPAKSPKKCTITR